MLTSVLLVVVLTAVVILLTLSAVGLALPALAAGYLAGVFELPMPLRRVLVARQA